jgi:hypothetical protein
MTDDDVQPPWAHTDDYAFEDGNLDNQDDSVHAELWESDSESDSSTDFEDVEDPSSAKWTTLKGNAGGWTWLRHQYV